METNFEVLGNDKFGCYEVSTKLMEYYGYYRKKYVDIVRGEDGQQKFTTVRKHLDPALMMNHLRGDFTLATFASPKATKFISVDVDEGDPAVVHRVVDTMVEMGIPRDRVYVSFSGKKGYHVDIFIRDFLLNKYARMFYVLMIDRSALDPRKVEFRPTSGQAIKVPLGIHQATGRRCWYVDRDTLLPIEDLKYPLTMEMVDQQTVQDIVAKLGKEYMARLYAEYEAQVEEIKKDEKEKRVFVSSDLDVKAPGTRHQLQVKVAIKARREGASRTGVYFAQMDWYQRQNKLLIRSSAADVQIDANMIADWVVNHVKPSEHAESLKAAKKDAPVAVITKQDIPYIMTAPTKTARMLALLIWIYCRRYGKAKLAISTMMDKADRSNTCVVDSIHKLIDLNIIRKEKVELPPSVVMAIRQSNVYLLPVTLKRKVPDDESMLRDQVNITDWITNNLEDVYISTLAQMCSLDYLSEYLTKEELKACKEYQEGMKLNAGQSAGDDAGGGT